MAARTAEVEDRMSTIAELAREKGLTRVATRIQEAKSLALIWEQGIEFAQGYYFQAPARSLSYDFTLQA